MKKILMAIASAALACGIGFAAVGCGSNGTTINVYNREPSSGTRAAFIELLGIEETELIHGASQFDATGKVLTAVAGDANGIGYISLGSVDETVKAIKVDGVEATVENVKNNKYSVARPFELMYQQEKYDQNDLLRDFITFLQSSDAQEIINDYGFVSIKSDAKPYVKPEGEFETKTLNVAGSTSVQPLMATDNEDDGVTCLVTAYKEACGQNVEINVSGGGSSVGITNAANGTIDIGMASKEVKNSDFQNPTGTMVIYELCKDGIAVIVNKDNAVSDLKKSDLVNIYTGKVTDWSSYTEQA